jgi:hypothetical protein
MRRPRFDPGPFHVRGVIAEVALGQVVLREFLFVSVCVSSLLYYPLRLHVVLTRRTGGRSLGIFKKRCYEVFRKLGSIGQ